MILDASLASSIVGNAGGASALCSVMLTSNTTLHSENLITIMGVLNSSGYCKIS